MSAAEQSTVTWRGLESAALEQELDALDTFAALDPVVVWPGGRHPSAASAVCSALDTVREREHRVLDLVESASVHVTEARTLAGETTTQSRPLEVELDDAAARLRGALAVGGRIALGSVLVDDTSRSAGDTRRVDEHDASPGPRDDSSTRRPHPRRPDRLEWASRRVVLNLDATEAAALLDVLDVVDDDVPDAILEPLTRVRDRLRPRVARAARAARVTS